MKQIQFAIASLSALLLANAAPLFAQNTAYMCSQANIKFEVGVSGDYDSYVWTLDGDTLVAGSGVTFEDGGRVLKIGSTSNLLQATSNTASTKTIGLQVAKTGDGCYSTLEEYTVHVLPKPEVTIATVTNYCADAPNAAAELVATTTTISGLPTDVTANVFEWNNGTALGGGTVTSPSAGTWESVLTYTSPSNTTPVDYTVTVDYSLPGGASLIGDCSSDAATATVESYATPTAPSIVVGGF